MTPPIVEIHLNEHGMGTLTIDGHDFAGATFAARVETRVGELPRVILELHASAVKVNVPAEIIANVRNNATPDQEAESRIVDRVIRALRAEGLTVQSVAEDVVRRLRRTPQEG